MKTAVIYYSFSGKTKSAAGGVAREEDADLFEVKTKKRYSFLTAFFRGSPAAMKQNPVEIQPLGCAFEDYDKLVLMAPIWGGFPAPPFNAVVELLPAGKEVGLIMVSGGGLCKNADKIKALVESRGCTVTDYKDQKGQNG